MTQLEFNFSARYGRNIIPPPSVKNDLAAASTLSLLLAHRSVRAYLPDPLGQSVLTALVAAAQSAPTSSNLQAWSVVAISDTERKAQLSALAGSQKHICDCPLFLVWLADLSRLERTARRRGECAAAVSYLELYSLALVDVALAAQNAAVAAESMGLGTVYIGGIRNHPEQTSALLELPDRTFAVFGMCVGYPDPARPADIKPRLPMHAVLHRERYSSLEEASAVAAYDNELAAFQRQQGMQEIGWSRQASKRVAGAHSLSGRDRLRTALQNLGFDLK